MQVNKEEPYPCPVTRENLLKNYCFDKIDRIALEAFDAIFLRNTLEHLVSHLVDKCSDELEKVRILYRWVTSPKISEIDCNSYSNETVGDRIKSLKSNRYAEFFFEMCR